LTFMGWKSLVAVLVRCWTRAPKAVARGGVSVARQILEQALGTGRAMLILEKIQEQVVDTGLKRLKKAAPEVLAGILRGEHPQTIALILAHLDVRQAAGLVEAMDPELAGEVLYRVARTVYEMRRRGVKGS